MACSAKQVSRAASITASSGELSWPRYFTISAVSACGCIWQCHEPCLSEIPRGEFYKRLSFYSEHPAALPLPGGATLGHPSLLIHIPPGSSRTPTFRPRAWPPSSNGPRTARKNSPPAAQGYTPATAHQAIPPTDFSATTAAAHVFVCAGFRR